jgi:hypothetical protein
MLSRPINGPIALSRGCHLDNHPVFELVIDARWSQRVVLGGIDDERWSSVCSAMAKWGRAILLLGKSVCAEL